MDKDQAFLETVVKALVNNPSDVRTERKTDDKGVLITLHVNPDDLRYVIGKRGKTAQALRTLLHIVGAKTDQKVAMQIHEPEGSRPMRDDLDEGGGSSGRRDDRDPLDLSSLDDIRI